MLGLAAGLQKGGAALLNYVTDNLKLYLDFKKGKHDTLKFPCEGSTYFVNDDYINIGDDTSLDITGNITLSCWVKPTVVGVTRTIFGRDDGTNRNYFFMCNTSNQFNFSCFGLTDTTVLSSTTFSVGNWYHLMGTYDGARLKLYINGVLETNEASTGTINNTDVSFTIGARESGMDRHWDGYIANVGLWSRALSAEEVNSVMRKNYSQLKSVEKTSLVSWWALDDIYLGSTTNSSDSDQTVYDIAKIMEDKNGSVGSNLVPDGEFESGVDNWTVTSGTISLNGDGNMLITGVGGTANAKLNALTLETNTVYLLEIGIAGGTDTSINVRYDDEEFGETKYGGIYSNASEGTNASPKNVSSTFTSHSSNTGFYLNIGNVGDGSTAIISHVKLYKVTSGNYGSIFGATTTTSVYGGNAPVLPRAVDVAKEGEAEAIGNGSASFNGTSDIIDIGSDSILDKIFNGGATLTAWIKPSSDGENNFGRIFDKSSATAGTDGWHFLVTDESSSKVELRFGHAFSSSQAYWDSSLNVALNEWNHVAVTYDNSSTSNNPKFYINGISVTVTEHTAPSGSATDDSSQDLFIGNNTGLDRTFDGSIAGAGIWQGELTQAQIQSVMESTSYDKIPADVKSTLGSELITNNDYSTNDSTGYNNITSGWTFSGGTATWSGTGGATGVFYTVADIFDDANALYKVTLDIASISNCKVRLVRGGTDVVSVHTDTAGVYTTYSTITGTGPAVVGLTNGSGTTSCVLNSVSVKKVTNEIVGYWALDSSDYTSASNHITNGDASSSSPVKPEWNISGQDFTYNEYNSSIARVTDFGSSGNTSWKVTLSAGSGNWGMKTSDADMNVGRSYKVSCKVYIPSSTDISSVAIRWYKGSSGLGESVSTTTKDSWTELTFTIPSFWSTDGSYAQIVSFGQSGASADDYFYFDDLVIKPHSVPDSTDNNNVGDLI